MGDDHYDDDDVNDINYIHSSNDNDANNFSNTDHNYNSDYHYDNFYDHSADRNMLPGYIQVYSDQRQIYFDINPAVCS